jgi:hypothetical protein
LSAFASLFDVGALAGAIDDCVASGRMAGTLSRARMLAAAAAATRQHPNTKRITVLVNPISVPSDQPLSSVPKN